MDFSNFVLFVVGFIVGLTFLTYLQLRRLRSMEDELIDSIQNDLERRFREMMVPVVLEQHDGKLFMYHKDTYQYLTSGETVGELVETFEERFPDKRASIEDGDDELVERFERDLEDYYGGIRG